MFSIHIYRRLLRVSTIKTESPIIASFVCDTNHFAYFFFISIKHFDDDNSDDLIMRFVCFMHLKLRCCEIWLRARIKFFHKFFLRAHKRRTFFKKRQSWIYSTLLGKLTTAKTNLIGSGRVFGLCLVFTTAWDNLRQSLWNSLLLNYITKLSHLQLTYRTEYSQNSNNIKVPSK